MTKIYLLHTRAIHRIVIRSAIQQITECKRLVDISKLANKLRKAKQESIAQEKMIADTKAKSLSDIDCIFDNMVKYLDQRKCQLVAIVHDKSNSLMSTVQKTSAAHEQTLAIIESTDTYFQQAKEKADVVEMLQMFPAIKRSVEDLQAPEPVPYFNKTVAHFTFLKHYSKDTETLIRELGSFTKRVPFREESRTVPLDSVQFAAVKHFFEKSKLSSSSSLGLLPDGRVGLTTQDTPEGNDIMDTVVSFNREHVNVLVTDENEVKILLDKVMKDHRKVYMQLNPDEKTVTIISYDWAEMSAAKKKVQMKFGLNKATSRSRRKFAASVRPKGSDSQNTNKNTKDEPPQSAGGISHEECVICRDVLKKVKTLVRCGHSFCHGCIDYYFQHYKPVCPVCGVIYGAVMGDMPPGTMRVRRKNSTFAIFYHIPDGIQTEDHPSPGESFKGVSKLAYLPKTREGETVLRLLMVAFDRRLTFTVHRSMTPGQEDAVTWNDIHHKTDDHGARADFPDASYLKRITHELAAKGVTKDDIDWTKPLINPIRDQCKQS